MIKNSISVLPFVTPIFTSAGITSFSSFKNIGKSNNERSPNFSGYSSTLTDNLGQDYSLLTKGQCHIRRATPKEDSNLTGIVPIAGPVGGETGEFVFNDEAGVTADDTRVVLPAFHGIHDKNGNRPTIILANGKIDPTLFKINVQSCATDQDVVATCFPNGDLNDQKNDYSYLILENQNAGRNQG